jgi:hypothetical protein
MSHLFDSLPRPLIQFLQQLVLTIIQGSALKILLQGMILMFVWSMIQEESRISYLQMSNRERKYKRKQAQWAITKRLHEVIDRGLSVINRTLAFTDVHWKTKKKKGAYTQGSHHMFRRQQHRSTRIQALRHNHQRRCSINCVSHRDANRQAQLSKCGSPAVSRQRL